MPPHAIHANGVGPYELGMPLPNILTLLPRGPRVVLAQIDDVLDYDIVRADDDAVIVGAARSRTREVAFVSVLDQRIARTEHGIGVGTSLAKLRQVMGEPANHPTLAMDPRMVAFGRLPEARFVLARHDDKPTVAAVTVRRNRPEHTALLAAPAAPSSPGEGVEPTEPERPEPARSGARPAPKHSPDKSGPASAPGIDPASADEPSADKNGLPAAERPPCTVAPSSADVDKILNAIRLPLPQHRHARVQNGCFSASADDLAVRESLVILGSQIVVVGGEPGRLRRLAAHSTGDVVYAVTLDIDTDKRHEIAVVSQRVTARERERERISRIEVLRYESGRLHRLADAQLYRLSTSNAAWVGASLNEIDLLLELWTGPERVEVTGLFVQWGARGRPINVAQLMPVTVPIRRKRATPGPGTPAPARDSGAPVTARDAGAIDARPVPDASTGPARPTATDSPRTDSKPAPAPTSDSQ